MEYSMTQLTETLAQITPNRYLQAILIIVVFAVLAKIVDVVLTRFIKRLIEKTKFTLDDQLLDIFHKPIFVSIMLLGLALATDRMGFSQTVYFVTMGGLKTVAIFTSINSSLSSFGSFP